MSNHERQSASELPPHIVPVELKGELLGHLITEHDKSIDLRSMFNRGVSQFAEEADFKYSLAYFRTKGDWIYQLSHLAGENGQLVGPSRQTGRVVTETFWDQYISIHRALRIDSLFIYDSGGTKYTPVVTEIIGVLRDSLSSDDLRKITKGRINSIIEEFEAQE